MAPARATGVIAAAAAIAVAIVSNCYICKSYKRGNQKKKLKPRKKDSLTPLETLLLIRINSLSDATGCEETRGVMYTKEEAEGRRLNNPFDTRTEVIGINRSTQNFMMAKLDGAFRGRDKEAVEMSRFLVMNDGHFPVSFPAMNGVGAVRVGTIAWHWSRDCNQSMRQRAEASE